MERGFTYTIKVSKRAKRLRLAVYCDGSVIVTSPKSLEESFIDRFVKEKTQWVLEKITLFKENDNEAIKIYSKEDFLENKGKAFVIIKSKVKKYNQKFKFGYNEINIKNQKTKWGSCSKKKNLNFNYKIMFLNEELQNYIIVHELCHLKEMNHSRKFWTLVERALPEYREIKQELKKMEMYYK